LTILRVAQRSTYDQQWRHDVAIQALMLLGGGVRS
jgi:hypothetical protein